MREEEVQLVVRPVLFVGETRRPRIASAEDVGRENPHDLGRNGAGHVGVDAEQLWWGQYAHLIDDDRPPVAPLCHELLVAEALHQLDPGRGNVDRIPARGARLAREPVSRKGRNHDVKRILGLAAVCRGVSEWTDEVEHLDD